MCVFNFILLFRSQPRHEGRPEYLMSSPVVTAVARRELAIAIRDLMQHGLVQVNSKKYFFLKIRMCKNEKERLESLFLAQRVSRSFMC